MIHRFIQKFVTTFHSLKRKIVLFCFLKYNICFIIFTTHIICASAWRQDGVMPILGQERTDKTVQYIDKMMDISGSILESFPMSC